MINIYYIGRVAPIKDLPTLQAAVEILKTKKIEAKLTVVSSYLYKDNDKIFKKADIVVIPTLSKALDKVFLEALACKKLAVGTDIGYPFMVKNFPQLLFRAHDPNDLAERIIWHLKNKSRSKLIVKKAYEYVKANFSLDILMDKIVKSFYEFR